MNIQRIEENEIPYEELGKFGLTQEMIDDLPEPIMNKLLGGMRTPLLPIEQVDEDGVIHKDFARIRLIKEGEQVHPMFLPVKNKGNLEYFTGEEKEALERGKVLKVILPSNSSWNYVQLDSSTNSIISVKSNLVDNNLSLLANNMGMDEDHILKLENGEVVTLENDNQMLSIGIDLNEETGILNVKGDAQAWQKERDGIFAFDKYNFGIYGCWTRDDKGMLSYVPEDEYTEEMCVEQDAILQKVKANRGMHI